MYTHRRKAITHLLRVFGRRKKKVCRWSEVNIFKTTFRPTSLSSQASKQFNDQVNQGWQWIFMVERVKNDADSK